MFYSVPRRLAMNPESPFSSVETGFFVGSLRVDS